MKYMVETMNIDFQQKWISIFNRNEILSSTNTSISVHYLDWQQNQVHFFNKHFNLITLLRFSTERKFVSSTNTSISLHYFESQQNQVDFFNKHFNLITLLRFTTEPSWFLQETLQSHYITSIHHRTTLHYFDWQQNQVDCFNKQVNLITLLRFITETRYYL